MGGGGEQKIMCAQEREVLKYGHAQGPWKLPGGFDGLSCFILLGILMQNGIQKTKSINFFSFLAPPLNLPQKALDSWSKIHIFFY